MSTGSEEKDVMGGRRELMPAADRILMAFVTIISASAGPRPPEQTESLINRSPVTGHR